MLVLSRQRDESIVIGDDIVVTVVDIRGDKVRLGIECPGEIPVHRREVFDAIKRNELYAACSDGLRLCAEFRNHMTDGRFEEAFDVLYKDRGEFFRNYGTREEVDNMVKGLDRGI